jgi:hypothetical protein
VLARDLPIYCSRLVIWIRSSTLLVHDARLPLHMFELLLSVRRLESSAAGLGRAGVLLLVTRHLNLASSSQNSKFERLECSTVGLVK